jgi:hypothetical protein
VVVLDASALLAFFSTWAGPGLRVSLQLIR